MKKIKIIYWIVAVVMVGLMIGSYIHVHNAEKQNAIKIAKQQKIDKAKEKKIKRLNKQQKQRLVTPIDWTKPSLSGNYPDLSQYKHLKKKSQRIWLEVSPKKQRVYVKQGPYTLYTMYASIGKNYDNGKKPTESYQKTPTGTFKIQKQRGQSYYNAALGYGAKYWTSFDGHGMYRFESVPVDQNGNFIKAQAKRLGSTKVTRKNNIEAYGCIRLSEPDAKWIMENIKPKTYVVVHGKDSDDDNFLEFLED